MLDAGEANLPSIGEAKAAPIDDSGNTSFALLLKRAIGGVCARSVCHHQG
jgi:hypothetical protein